MSSDLSKSLYGGLFIFRFASVPSFMNSVIFASDPQESWDKNLVSDNMGSEYRIKVTAKRVHKSRIHNTLEVYNREEHKQEWCNPEEEDRETISHPSTHKTERKQRIEPLKSRNRPLRV